MTVVCSTPRDTTALHGSAAFHGAAAFLGAGPVSARHVKSSHAGHAGHVPTGSTSGSATSPVTSDHEARRNGHGRRAVHDYHVLALYTGGHARMEQRGSWELCPGDALLVPAGEPHRLLETSRAEYWGLAFVAPRAAGHVAAGGCGGAGCAGGAIRASARRRGRRRAHPRRTPRASTHAVSRARARQQRAARRRRRRRSGAEQPAHADPE